MNLINRSAVKKLILETIDSKRPGLGINRVSGDALDRYNQKLREFIEKDVMTHPTIGKTFKPE